MITRRKFLSLAATSAAALSIAGCERPSMPPNEMLMKGSKKKGLGQSTKNPNWANRLSDLNCKWFYSWNSAIPDGVPQGVDFIPMMYRYAGDMDQEKLANAVASAQKAGVGDLLGFNEPEKKNQGNMTMEQVLDAWPLLMETGLRLGSPGCVHPDKEWMIEFMAAVKERNLRVDFICAHSYGGPNAESLVKRLEKVHKMFDERPIWITEFAVGDWEAKSAETNRHKPDAVLRFMESVLPKLDKLDFVERYAWFPAKPTSLPLGTSALFDAEGRLTRLGECYRDA
jgi:hypothetical protein